MRSGARIDVTPEAMADPMSHERVVTIQGNPDAIERARALIEEIVAGMPQRVGFQRDVIFWREHDVDPGFFLYHRVVAMVVVAVVTMTTTLVATIVKQRLSKFRPR